MADWHQEESAAGPSGRCRPNALSCPAVWVYTSPNTQLNMFFILFDLFVHFLNPSFLSLFVSSVHGVRDLFWLPIEQYRKDGRIIRGLQRGAASFGTSTASAALELSNRLVQAIQVLCLWRVFSAGPQVCDAWCLSDSLTGHSRDSVRHPVSNSTPEPLHKGAGSLQPAPQSCSACRPPRRCGQGLRHRQRGASPNLPF